MEKAARFRGLDQLIHEPGAGGMTTTTDIEATARQIGEAIPDGARRLGWNVADLRLSMVLDDFTGDMYEEWSVRVIGPVAVDSRVVTPSGDWTPRYAPVLSGGTLGTLTATSSERLLEDLRYWVQEMHLADLAG